MEERNCLLEIRQGSETGPLLYRYAYDDNGSRIEKRDSANNLIQGYTWDQKRRIKSVQQGSSAVDMVYDTSDYRVGKATGSSPEDATVYYREAEHLEAAYDGNDTLKEKYLRGAVVDELINGYSYDENGQGTSATYHHDHLRSVVAETGHDGSVLSTIKYDPFGNVLNETGVPQSDLRYTGRMYDPETNLYYYRARYYDAEVGRFISEDPLGFEAGVNFYAYVLNNPLGHVDPYGFDDIVTWRLSMGLQAGYNARVAGIVSVSAVLDFGSVGQTSGTYTATATQTFGGGVSVGPWGVNPTTTREVNASGLNPYAAFDGESFSDTEWSISGGPGSATAAQGDIVLDFGVQALLGIETSVNLTEAGRQLGGWVYETLNPDWSTSVENASGGFVIYPSRVNLNGSSGAYEK